MDNATPEYVGFWCRVFAALIDSILIVVILYPFLTYVLNDPLGFSLAGQLAQFILPAIAFIAFWQAKSSTPGKMLLGAQIVDADSGGKPSTQQWLLRYLGYYLSTIPLLLGLLWVGIDKRKQGWHDKLARTVVIKKPSAQHEQTPAD